MKNFIKLALGLLIPFFYHASAEAVGCGALASGEGTEGNKLVYRLSSPIVSIDPDAPTGSILWTRNINTAGAKWLCQSTAQRTYQSVPGPAYSKIVGSNSRGNIYDSGIEGLGIQISDLFEPHKAVANMAYPTAQQAMTWGSKGYTRIDFIKVGPIGSGNLTNGDLAIFTYDGIDIMKIKILGSRFKYKSCTIDGSYNRTIPLGIFNTTDITTTSPDFEFKLKCQADAVPVYVQFDSLYGSSGDGLLNIDSSVEKPAGGLAVEIINSEDRSALKLAKEKQYHNNLETSITIPLIARYKKTGSTITPGQANAGMTITINEH